MTPFDPYQNRKFDAAIVLTTFGRRIAEGGPQAAATGDADVRAGDRRVLPTRHARRTHDRAPSASLRADASCVSEWRSDECAPRDKYGRRAPNRRARRRRSSARARSRFRRRPRRAAARHRSADGIRSTASAKREPDAVRFDIAVRSDILERSPFSLDLWRLLNLWCGRRRWGCDRRRRSSSDDGGRLRNDLRHALQQNGRGKAGGRSLRAARTRARSLSLLGRPLIETTRPSKRSEPVSRWASCDKPRARDAEPILVRFGVCNFQRVGQLGPADVAT